MANIHVVLDTTISDGSKLKFRTPCDSTEIEGLEVKTPAKNGVGTVIKKFVFKDAHGAELSGVGNLFVGGVLIEVLLDVTHGVAYIKNADTNSYVESVKSDIQRMEEIQKQFLAVAGKSVEECEHAAKAIYIGGGDIPEDAIVQIDPSGDVQTVDFELNGESHNPIANKTVAGAVAELQSVIESITLTMDTELIEDSENPVENKVVAGAIKDLQGTLFSIQGGMAQLSASLVSLSERLNSLKAEEIITEQDGSNVEDSLSGLWGTKVSATDFVAENIPYSYKSTSINNVADALTLLLGKAGV